MVQDKQLSSSYVSLEIRLSLLSLTVFLAGCNVMLPFRSAPGPVPAPNVPTARLLISADPFPGGWVVFSCEPHCDRRERNGDSGRSFGIVGVPGHVIQHVLYFEREWAAQANFQRYEETDLPETVDPNSVQSLRTAFSPPYEIKYRSPIADEQYLGCGIDEVPACRAGLRYGNYFTYFYFDLKTRYYMHYLDDDIIKEELLHEGGLTFSQVEKILRAMDEHYAELFDLQIPDEDTE